MAARDTAARPRPGGGGRPAVAIAPKLREDGLQIDEDRPFQERWWTAQRVGQALFAALIGLALAGFGGNGGWFAEATVETRGGEARYPRFARWGGGAELSVAFDGAPRLALEGFTDWFDVEAVTPAPARQAMTGATLMLEFAEAGGPALARLTVRPRRPGLARWRIALGDGPPAPASTLVLP